MSNFFRQLRGLPHQDKLRFCGIVFSVLTLKIALKVFGFKRTVKFLKGSLQDTPMNKKKPLTYYRNLLKLCNLLFSRFGYCLPISLTFWRILESEGIKTNLYFGIRKADKKLLSHAWLEYQGIPLVGKENNRKNYKSFEILIASDTTNC